MTVSGCPTKPATPPPITVILFAVKLPPVMVKLALLDDPSTTRLLVVSVPPASDSEPGLFTVVVWPTTRPLFAFRIRLLPINWPAPRRRLWARC